VGTILGALVLALATVVGIAAYVDSSHERQYNNALGLMRFGDYQVAYGEFVDLEDYKDSPARAATCRQHLDYAAAQQAFDAGDFETAKNRFEELGEFQDSGVRALESQDHIDFLSGQAAHQVGDYDEAIKIFARLTAVGFDEAGQWLPKSYYARGDQRQAAGELYPAYRDFRAADPYEDSAQRAEACTLPFPASGELYHNDDFISQRSEIHIESGLATHPYYVRVYAGEVQVLTLAVNPGESTHSSIPPGDYTFKVAVGSAWFGEDDRFGDEGTYEVLVFEDGTTTMNIPDSIAYTLTLRAAGGEGNVSQEKLDPGDF
jgi:tetratricopeptide (TPR) repeat protein